MRGVLKLLVVAAVVFLGYTQLMPRFERRQEAERQASADRDELAAATACVEAAEQANAFLSREMAGFARPPVDPALWGNFLLESGSLLTTADDSCRCSHDSCGEAGLAVDQLRRRLMSFDRAVRAGDAGGLGEQARQQKRAATLLASARRRLD